MGEPTTISICEAKAKLSKLVKQIESDSGREIVITRAGKPVAKLVSVPSASIRLGVADGAFQIPDDLDVANPTIEKLFNTPSVVATKVRPRR